MIDVSQFVAMLASMPVDLQSAKMSAVDMLRPAILDCRCNK